jgi:hypothetical protein
MGQHDVQRIRVRYHELGQLAFVRWPVIGWIFGCIGWGLALHIFYIFVACSRFFVFVQ